MDVPGSESFSLRAHHVQLLIDSQEPASPEEVAREVVDVATARRGEATRATVNLGQLAGEYTLDDEETARAYGIDMLGDTVDQTQRFGKSILNPNPT